MKRTLFFIFLFPLVFIQAQKAGTLLTASTSTVNGTSAERLSISPVSVRMMTSNQIGLLSIGSGDKFGLVFEIIPESNSGKSPLSVGSLE